MGAGRMTVFSWPRWMIIRCMRKQRPKKVIVVTGASAGVGRPIAAEFGRPGHAAELLTRSRGGLVGA